MDNPEKLSILGTQDTGRRQTKIKTQHRKLKRWAVQIPLIIGGEVIKQGKYYLRKVWRYQSREG
jgi:hypothetical protein